MSTTTPNEDEIRHLTKALSQPFDLKEVKFKPQAVKGNRALAIAYIDCRVIQDRLDEVLGVEGWQDEYDIQPDGSVVCKLQLRLAGQWVSKMDVGSPSEQPDGGDRLKAAFSDALKRAAVKFGIGRYLYRLPATWTDYDPVKKQFSQPPQLPLWAIPKSKQPAPVTVAAPPALPALQASKLPANGSELHRRLRDYDTKLAGQKLCQVGTLLAHVTQAGVRAGYGDDVSKWNDAAIAFAVQAVKQFEAGLRSGTTEPKPAA